MSINVKTAKKCYISLKMFKTNLVTFRNLFIFRIIFGKYNLIENDHKKVDVWNKY